MSDNSETGYSCIGYHGTEYDNALSILRNKNFIQSCTEDEWLGDGVYFFENDERQAICFITKARKVQNYKVIKANIKTKNLLDLIDLETYENFEQFARQFKDRYLKKKDNRPRKLINSVVLKAMYKLKPYDVVRAVFPVPQTQPAPRTNIQPMQIQICVKEPKCITDIKEV